MLRAGLTLLLLALLLAAAACGQGALTSRSGVSAVSAQLDRAESIGADSATVELVPAAADSYTVRLAGLQEAKAVYGHVAYDPAQQHLLSTDSTGGRLTDDGRVLMVVDVPSEGRVYFGMVLADYHNRPGLNGSLDLTRLSFGAGAVPVARAASVAPTSVFDEIELTGSVDAAGIVTLAWEEALAGDGTNDGLVAISDLTPFGAVIKQAAPEGDPTKSPQRDADYNKDGLVTVNDLTAMGANFNVSLGGYAIFAGPVGGTLVEVDQVDRIGEEFPAKPPVGEVFWDWVSPNPIAVDTTFVVEPYDITAAKNRGKRSNTIDLVAPVLTQTITDIDISFDNAVVIDTGTELRLILTEAAVDSVPNNAEPFTLENLQLTATVETAEDPGNPFDGTDMVTWNVIDGGGLADVSNADGSEGLLTFHDRGLITVQAMSPTDFAVTDEITFRLLSISSIELAAVPGGAGPVSVNAGTAVAFSAIGTFDSDEDESNGNEETQDITDYVNWAVLPDATNTGTYSVDTGAATLETAGADSGDSLRVTVEFPRTDDVQLHDNQKRASNFVRVNIN
jgi:hypothetical protein